MSNTASKWVAGLFIVGALGVGVPWSIGHKVESDFRAAIAAAPDHYPYPVSLLRYERGLFSSVAETQQMFDIGPDPDDITIDDDGNPVMPPSRLVPLTLHHAISHGPRLDGIRLVRFVNTLKLEGNLQKAVSRVFGTAEPVTLTVDIGFGGGASGALVSPAVDTTLPADGDAKASHILWSGLTGRFSMNGDHLIASLDAPGLKIDDNAFVIGPVTMKTDLTAVADTVWTGTFGSTFASFSANGAAGAVSLSDLHVDSDTTDTSGILHSGATVTFKEMRFNEVSVSDSRLRLMLDRIGTQALAELSRTLNRYTAQQAGKTPDATDLQRMFDAMKPSLAALATRQPIFAVEDLSFTSPQGKVQFSGQVQYLGDGNFEDFAVGTDVAAGAKLAAPLALIDLMLQMRASKAVIPGPDGEPIQLSAEQIAASAQASRDGAIAQGLLTVDGDRASTVVEFKGGTLTVNGKPLGAQPI